MAMFGAPGIHSTKMQFNLSNWSKAGSVPAGGFWCLLCSISFPGRRSSGVLGWELGEHHCPATEAPGPKEDVNEP